MGDEGQGRQGGIGCKRVECECVWWGMYYYTNDGRWEMRAKGGRVGLVVRGSSVSVCGEGRIITLMMAGGR